MLLEESVEMLFPSCVIMMCCSHTFDLFYTFPQTHNYVANFTYFTCVLNTLLGVYIQVFLQWFYLGIPAHGGLK